MNPIKYFEDIVGSFQEYRWLIELANAYYPFAAMSKMHTVISEERRNVRHKRPATKSRIPPVKQSSNASTSSKSLTTAIANETHTSSSSSTNDTLSMISTPWSTETWKSKPVSSSFSSSPCRSNYTRSSYTSVEPKTRTTTSGRLSLEVKTESNLTVTLLDELITPSASRYEKPLNRRGSESSPTYTSWTLETYTSTGIISSFSEIKVNYPWSPSTFRSTEFSDNYPSSPTLISQKGSRECFGKFEPRKPFTPMNVLLCKDDHPMLDWILVKQQGIPC